jgi:putative flippase GtrA
MTLQRKSSGITLLARNLLVVVAGIGFALALSIGVAKPFDTFSYFVAAIIGLASIIIFGWACYMGYRKHNSQ